MNSHTSLGIAQIVFYVPATFYTHYVGIRCWKYGPKMAWYPLMMFALVRLAGGVLVILYQQDRENISLIKATYVLLNIGLVPLLTTFNRLAILISSANFPNNEPLRKMQKICGILILVAAGLLGAAGGMTGKPEEAAKQSKFSKIAYFEFLAVLMILGLLCVGMYVIARHKIRKDHLAYLRWLLFATPPLAARTAYGVIGVFEATGKNITTSKWSPLFGSATAFALMALLPEYIVLGIYMYMGHTRIHACRRHDWVDDRPPKKSLKDTLKSNFHLQDLEHGEQSPSSRSELNPSRIVNGRLIGR